MRGRPPAGLAAALVALSVLVLPGLDVAQGQADDNGLGMSPERFTLDTAQPGQSYQLTVSLQNRRGVDDTVEVSLEGVVGGWASTTPPSPFSLAAGTDRDIILRVDVPANAGPGTNDGIARFTGQPGPGPSGSGASVRPSLGLLLEVTVGGQAVQHLSWIEARVEDTPEGQPVPAFLKVRNDGNVRSTAEAEVEVLPFEGDTPILAEANGSLVVVPGETAEVPMHIAAGLPQGQYRARVSAADQSFSEVVEFKVTAPGQQAPAAILRVLEHAPTVAVGRPLRVEGWFENTGGVDVAAARLTLELRRDGELVDVVTSEALAVPAGTHANLTVYVTPEKAGSYTLAGQATYDGYQTLERESLLSVTPAKAAGSWWWLLLVLIVLTLLAWLWAWRKGRRDRLRELERRGRRGPR